MKITKNTRGFIQGLSSDEYHNSKLHYSSSVLKQALDKPYEFYKERILGEEPKKQSSDALDIGTYCHTVLLEPELVDKEYAIFTGSRRQGKLWEIFQAENQNKIIITSSQKELVDKIADQFYKSQILLPDESVVNGDYLFSNGKAEESLFTSILDLPIKVRFDYRIENGRKVIRDLKTTKDTPNSVEDARKLIYGSKYHLSAALYVDAIKEETGDDYDFEWVFVSKEDFKTNTYIASKECLTAGRELYIMAIERIKKWFETKKYVTALPIREV